MWARASSTAENSRALSPASASLRVSCVRSVMIGCRLSRSLDDLRHDEVVAVGLGRVGEDLGGIAAVGDHIVARRQLHRLGGGERGDALRVDLVQLLDPGEDAGELGRQRLEPILLDANASEPGDLANGRGVDGHGASGLTRRGLTGAWRTW